MLAYVVQLVIVAVMKLVRKLVPSLLLLFVMVSVFACFKQPVHAVSVEPSLLIGQVKITASSGQFLTIYNNSAETIDMSSVQLAYFNNYDLTKSTSSKFITLSGKLAPQNYYLISDGALFVCFKMTVNAQSLGFSSTAGMVQLIKLTQAGAGGLVTTSLLDSVAWSKTTVAGAQTLPTASTDFLQRNWASNTEKVAGGGTWQTVHPDGTNPCDLQVQLNTSQTPTAETLGSYAPAVRAVAVVAEKTAVQNVGLVAPEITEILPNPKSPQTDDADEFIEIYNPNDSIFSMKGYRLEAGMTYSRGFTFNEGSLQPKSYTVFKITDTNVQLSNTEGQVRLLNPAGDVINEIAAYEDAPEGSSWGIVGDSWQWLALPTPGVLNSTPSSPGSVTTIAKTATKTASAKIASTAAKAENTEKELEDAAPLHPLVLAGVGVAAVAYAAYEYRKDMANALFRTRRYLRNRRTARQGVQGRGSIPAAE